MLTQPDPSRRTVDAHREHRIAAAEVTFSTTREEGLGEIDVAPRPPSRVWRVIGRILAAVGAVILLVFILGPLVWMGISAFAERWKYPNMLPQSWTLSWWGKVLGGSDLMPALLLSLRFAILATLFSAIICLPAAYALGRRSFFGRRTILSACSRPTPSRRWVCSSRWRRCSTRCT